jgi:hypothetical protein
MFVCMKGLKKLSLSLSGTCCLGTRNSDRGRLLKLKLHTMPSCGIFLTSKYSVVEEDISSIVIPQEDVTFIPIVNERV